MSAWWRTPIGLLLSIGGYAGESETQRSKRRIFVGATVIATLLTMPIVVDYANQGYTKWAISLLSVVMTGPVILVILYPAPRMVCLARQRDVHARGGRRVLLGVRRWRASSLLRSIPPTT